MASIGMMDAAFFVGRREILDWANATFAMRLERIEETANGAVLCQILDAIYPDGAVPMGKVRWDARTEPEMVSNYKLVQAVFTAKGVDKHIDVAKLVRAKYQDNLECMQVSSAARSTVDGAYGRSPARPRARARRPLDAPTPPRRPRAPAHPAVGHELLQDVLQRRPVRRARAARQGARRRQRARVRHHRRRARCGTGGRQPRRCRAPCAAHARPLGGAGELSRPVSVLRRARGSVGGSRPRLHRQARRAVVVLLRWRWQAWQSLGGGCPQPRRRQPPSAAGACVRACVRL